MKHRITSFLLGLAVMATLFARAAAAPVAELTPVARALKEAGYLSEREARPQAKFYIFFCSASWCGLCLQASPQVIAEYEQKISKREDVELILLNHDENPDVGHDYMKQHAPMLPGVMVQSLKLPARPVYKYIPTCFIVTAQGEIISVGGRDVFLNWENEICKKRKDWSARYGRRR